MDGAKAGDTIEVSAPRNDFELAGNPASYLFIAGGIGITPIRSMIHHLRNTGGKPYKLYYLSRTPEMTAFRDEFISPEYRGKAIVHHDHRATSISRSTCGRCSRSRKARICTAAGRAA